MLHQTDGDSSSVLAGVGNQFSERPSLLCALRTFPRGQQPWPGPCCRRVFDKMRVMRGCDSTAAGCLGWCHTGISARDRVISVTAWAPLAKAGQYRNERLCFISANIPTTQIGSPGQEGGGSCNRLLGDVSLEEIPRCNKYSASEVQRRRDYSRAGGIWN